MVPIGFLLIYSREFFISQGTFESPFSLWCDIIYNDLHVLKSYFQDRFSV